MHPKAQALLDAQLDFIVDQLKQQQLISNEVLGYFDWLKQQKITDFWSSQHITALLQQQILRTPTKNQLIKQIEQHIAAALQHPNNATTTIEDILPVETIDQMAQYIASKSEQRRQLIQQCVNSPTYIELMSKIVQQSVKDYMDQSIIAKRVPAVGSFIKMGKSVIELATDHSFDEALKLYLQKNLYKISNISEKLINQHFDDDTLYHFQAKLWHKIKKTPLSAIKQYIVVDDLTQTTAIGEQFWQHLRQTPYLHDQLQSAVEIWLQRHQHENFAKILHDINIDENLLRSELFQLVMPIIQHSIDDGYLINRIRLHLEQFYASEQVLKILTE